MQPAHHDNAPMIADDSPVRQASIGGLVMMGRPNSIADILDHVEETPESCWLWTGQLDRHGYGRVSFQGRKHIVHRLVYKHLVGPIAKAQLDHTCRNRACCNPQHLRPATNRENLLAPGSRALAAINARKVACPKCGGPYVTYDGKRCCLACRRAKRIKPESEPLLRERTRVLGTTQGELRGLPVPGTATATSKVSAFSPRLIRKR